MGKARKVMVHDILGKYFVSGESSRRQDQSRLVGDGPPASNPAMFAVGCSTLLLIIEGLCSPLSDGA